MYRLSRRQRSEETPATPSHQEDNRSRCCVFLWSIALFVEMHSMPYCVRIPCSSKKSIAAAWSLGEDSYAAALRTTYPCACFFFLLLLVTIIFTFFSTIILFRLFCCCCCGAGGGLRVIIILTLFVVFVLVTLTNLSSFFKTFMLGLLLSIYTYLAYVSVGAKNLKSQI